MMFEIAVAGEISLRRWFTAAAAAQLHERIARRSLRLWRA
jgi:hypothetical protein